ncbi:hypothetical protein YPPY13_2130 [Yersinia pestis PY-13]|uniref:Uncharacterized protein n=3 Tax=Yersinia pseudotuberculosis complex TaxID=1649845 RepID=A0A0U1QZM5_YERP3|nr:hypothetical protein YpsIP31758_2330 [Yersinia pseudotuberculosis IP 31758]EDR31972.1 hypothetical protein YPIP275_2171 [Yersinia pestis biovar Orientalis str. IP275]EDR39417.1 hypothetical protein YpF1991016_3801 [Yersinia pestis biovar Orientalis str. F1991016]EDR42447.1 hypothetical protein YpE1979001_4319 [Yersinia pestis biovar Antiqua str. E1979001]EDR52626.1 hypothetical protein YpB42003004_1169 [Yersinia pestis biovar Antiqua str. B42003004]EDR57820.1 hypothetical protein YpMG051020
MNIPHIKKIQITIREIILNEIILLKYIDIPAFLIKRNSLIGWKTIII